MKEAHGVWPKPWVAPAVGGMARCWPYAAWGLLFLVVVGVDRGLAGVPGPG